MADQVLRAIITVLDRTAEPLHQINERFAHMAAPLREIGSRLGELAEETGLKTIGERAREAFEHVHHLGHELEAIAAPLLALGAFASLGGFAEVVKETAEYGERLYLASRATGLTTEQLGGMSYAANLAGIQWAQLNRGLQYFNREIAEAARGKNKDVEAILGRMGLHNTQAHMVATADGLKAVADEAKHLVDTGHVQLASDMMAKLFGARSGQQLLPFFAQGSEHIQELMDEAARHGQALTAEQAKSAAEFMENYKQMDSAVLGLKYAIANELFPTLTPIVKTMTDWVDANRQWLATKIGDAVRSFGDWLRGIDFGAILQGMQNFIADAGWIIDKVGGITAALGILIAINLAPLILAVYELGAAVAGAAAKFIIFPVAGFLATLLSLAPAIDGVSGAMAALDIAMDANPIGAVVLVLGALAGAAYEIYEHWQPIAGFFKTLWADVEASFEAAWAYIGPIVDKIEHAIDWIGSHLPSLTGPQGGVGEMFDPSGTGALLPAMPMASPGAGAGGQSKTQVTVDFKNLPPGATVQTQHSGASPAEVNVGQAWAW